MKSLLSGYAATATAGKLLVDVSVTVDTPVLKADLLYHLVEALKDGREPLRSKDIFLDTARWVIRQYGVPRLGVSIDPLDYDAIAGGSDRTLRLLHDTWGVFFPNGTPKSVDFSITLTLTSEDLYLALGYARTYEGYIQSDQKDIPQFDAKTILYWVIKVYLTGGEEALEDFKDMSTETHSMSEAAVSKYFWFLDAKHEFHFKEVVMR